MKENEIQQLLNQITEKKNSASQVTSNAVLTQIGNEGDSPNTVPSVVTVVQLGQIVPAITGIMASNETAYQAYIDANPALFDAPATAAEVQAMVNAVNTIVILTQIGNEGDSPNTVPSVITDTQLLQITPAITGVTEANVTAYQAYIDAKPNLFSAPATVAEVQAMVNNVNGQVAVSNAVLAQIGNEGDSPNTVPSVVTVAQLGQITPAITGIVAANQDAYQFYIDGNPALFGSPATAIEVQAMVTTLNTNSVLTQIGNEGDEPNTVPSVVTVARLGQISPAITGIIAANEAAYQAYIDANPNLFASPATVAEVQAMVTAVNNSSVISGKIYEDADGGSIGGTPLSVGGTFLSIYAITSVVVSGSPAPHEVSTFKVAVPVASGTGVYTFPALPNGKYKIVIGTSADGSETASYPNVGNFSMQASAEGEAGTSGDGTPNGITFVTTSAGATVYSGSRVRADAGVDFAIKQLAPLPVRLISFTGKNTENGNLLNWKTSSEVNFSYFEVEKSSDAKKFEKIGKVDGNKGENYEFIDSTPLLGAGGLYRLKMMDLDGTFAYSKIIFIDAESQNSSVGQAYPNPAVGSTKIDINTKYSSVWTIKTFDIQGKLLNTQSHFLNKGNNTIDLKDLAKGMNYVQISNGIKTEIRKVVNQ